MPLNFPIVLTWVRVLLIPVFATLFYLPEHWIKPELANWLGAGIFAIAAITDWFDGYLARKWNQATSFGAFLDPVADKLIVAVALILLVDLDRTYAVMAMIIIGREITISALREWMAQMGKRNNVAVAQIGKIKTTAQMVAIVLLLIGSESFFGINLLILGNVLMLVASILTLWSMFYYLNAAFG
ncbi:MAG: CDP-diacylglycerol--glycerol-3-phosphate 3-phosphatidyltransferase, partial [Neisseriaceae bacterium]|nr:CDP-diacylglycerol--glycerol-3-phosphate 3-phosphatidyltransferase [Neisseriaceae bacterium]